LARLGRPCSGRTGQDSGGSETKQQIGTCPPEQTIDETRLKGVNATRSFDEASIDTTVPVTVDKKVRGSAAIYGNG
jgi:hypothetical protein